MDGHDFELTQSLLFIQFRDLYIYTHSVYLYIHRIKYLYILLKEKYSIMYMCILLYASILNINVQCRHVHSFLCPLQCFHIDLENPPGHNQRKGGQGNWWGTVFWEIWTTPKMRDKILWTGWWFGTWFFSSQLPDIFQRGWNHQPDG